MTLGLDSSEPSNVDSQPKLVSYSKVPSSDNTAPAMDEAKEYNMTPIEAQNGSVQPPVEPPPSYESSVRVDGGNSGPAGKDGGDDGGSDKKDKKEEKEEIQMVGALTVFRFADCWDILLMLLGTLSACIHGAALPGMLIVFGDMTDSFISQASSSSNLDGINFTEYGTTKEEALNDPNVFRQIIDSNDALAGYENALLDDLLDKMELFAIYYIIIAVVVLFVGYGQVTFWLLASFRQTQKIRVALFKAVLRQEIGWFDTHEAGELNTRLSDDVNKIAEGIGDKIGNFFQWFATFLAGIIIGFIYGWKLTLVILAVGPVLAISGAFMTKLTSAFTNKELHAYAKAGAVAEEVLGSIRTVTAFNGQQKECSRYNANLKEAKDFGVRKGLVAGSGMGLVFFIMFATYALAFWYGSKLVREDDHYTAGTMLIVFFCVLIGAFALGNAAPNLQNYGTARGAAFTIFNIIDNEPSIDSSSERGAAPATLKGNIEFKDVVFNYPARPEVTVLRGLSFKVDVGQTVALVGSSGCGKSTTVQLLQRFYDPAQGSITIDGQDIRELNIQWLRQHIGVVSQEPILFGTTIGENIRFGKDGVSQSDIEKAAMEGNAHDFIMKLPQKYNTLVGERGAQLSGGQKQRIAIARALVRDPRILLLDEATSALDTESEATVQAALDKARLGRTTIVIAHRLSTVKTADIIAGFRDGQVVEQGTHDELMKTEGVYHQLVTHQTMHIDEDDEFDDIEMSDVNLKRSHHGYGSARGSMHLKRGMSVISDKAVQRSLSGDGKGAEDEEEKLPDPDLRRVMRLNASEWYFILFGCLGAILTGAVQPAFAIIFSEILGVYSIIDMEEQTRKANLYAAMFLVIGAVAAIAMFVQSYFFAISGECLTMRLRQMAFRSFLRQEISYFDDHRNNTGSLTTRLATDASGVQGATGARLGTVCQSLASIGTGIIISFVFSWKLTLAILAFVPFMVIGGFVQMKMLGGYTQEGRAALESAGKVAIEAIENMRTVAGLTKEQWFLAEFIRLTVGPYKTSVKKSHINGITFSFTQCLTFLVHAAAFYLGAYLIKHDGLSFIDVFKVFAAIVFGAMAAGQASSFAPDYGKGKIAASRLFQLFDRIPTIDSFSTEGDTVSNVSGEVDFKEVHFCYPTRPTVSVLQGLNLSIKPGQRVALVGSSGCGKSTSVSLLERFYDTLDGQVLIDGKDLKSLNVQWLRQQMGIVQQEPILFDCSIRENIAYGDNNREVPMDEIIGAARGANIHSFIESLPEGYETNVGDKGTQLSGGQKQRVAIARALIRNPKVLLLDEATSALDTESEKVVQDALDRAQEGRTSIVIAHRLSTIVNADQIAVIRHGKVTELGTHSELIEQRGFYYKLHKTQSKQK